MPGPHDTPEFKALAAENAADHVIRKARWASMKEEFIDAMMTQKPVHWPTLSAKYGMQSQTARNRASLYKWYAEIEQRTKEREAILDAKMVERSTLAINQLNKDFATNETAIRSRHALIARGLQAKAVNALNGRDITKFTTMELLKMIELGIREERFAMGMSEVADLAAPSNEEGTSSVFKPIAEQVGGHKRMQELGVLLLKELKQANGSLDTITDVEGRDTEETKVYLDEGLTPPVQSVAPEAVAVAKPKIVVKHVSKEAAA